MLEEGEESDAKCILSLRDRPIRMERVSNLNSTATSVVIEGRP